MRPLHQDLRNPALGMTRTPLSVLVAPDKFKGSLGAAGVADSLAQGLRDAAPDVRVRQLPVADGGDGTIEVLQQAGFRIEMVQVEGPVGVQVLARLALRGEVGAVEIAETSGLALMGDGPLSPMRASSYGLGQAIVAALEHGCREVVVGLGGSANTDGGAGMLQALGGRLTTATGAPVARGGIGLRDLVHVDLDPARERLNGIHIVAACDVTNPLLGDDGAAHVYGPQKGATPDQVQELDRWLASLAKIIDGPGPGVAHRPGAGAAGGTGYALLALGAEFRQGTDVVLDLLGFREGLSGIDLVVTGEGSLDSQSLNGKAPIGVAQRAVEAGLRVVAVAGRVTLTGEQVRAVGFAQAYALTELEPDPRKSHRDAAALLREVGRRIAEDWVTGGRER